MDAKSNLKLDTAVDVAVEIGFLDNDGNYLILTRFLLNKRVGFRRFTKNRFNGLPSAAMRKPLKRLVWSWKQPGSPG